MGMWSLAMDRRPILLALAALALSGCATAGRDYGYGYCYDSYRGPVGYRYGPFEALPVCAPPSAQATFVAQEAGYRGPYVSGPHPGPVVPAPTIPAGAR